MSDEQVNAPPETERAAILQLRKQFAVQELTGDDGKYIQVVCRRTSFNRADNSYKDATYSELDNASVAYVIRHYYLMQSTRSTGGDIVPAHALGQFVADKKLEDDVIVSLAVGSWLGTTPYPVNKKK
ncbi:hypothetical protein BDP27DRAFT_1422502 [Rhodocollybia butyracea]|uniref:Uncharacterized protein n=1 Tax=Rhodocollybia butyracea TaxID=206335 RepID=A0A9P5PR84_9AGAR|nr:hypothetical protein BDP27DRAFT_1422502 [Rhodocollybia butyracea]